MEKLIIPYGMGKEIEVNPPKKDYSVIFYAIMISVFGLLAAGTIGAAAEAFRLIHFAKN